MCTYLTNRKLKVKTQFTFISITRYAIWIVLNQLHRNIQENNNINVAKFIHFSCKTALQTIIVALLNSVQVNSAVREVTEGL